MGYLGDSANSRQLEGIKAEQEETNRHLLQLVDAQRDTNTLLRELIDICKETDPCTYTKENNR